jgi:group II intron reverse transcriptase/maturase
VKVGEMQRKLSLWAEREKSHKFFDLYHLLYDKDWLRLAHDHVAQNAGSVTAGCDGINRAAFDEHLAGNLEYLAQELKAETFEPYPVRRVHIPKANGKVRPLGIPSLRDRIVQEAVRLILEPIYEADFSSYSFGFRPNRRTMDAIKCIIWSTQESKKFFWIIEGDIASYFDSINHQKLMHLIAKRVRDRKLLNLIQKFLQAGVMEGKLFRDTQSGTPQGGILSPLLANIYLHELDKYRQPQTDRSAWERIKRRRYGQGNSVYIRYADDFVVLWNGPKAEAEQRRAELAVFLKEHLQLKLALDKTKITHLNEGVVFLGFKVQRSRGQQGRGTKVLIPEAAVEKVLHKIAAATNKSTSPDSVTTKIIALNRIISGWCRYYQYTSKASSVFHQIEYKAFWLMAHWLGRKCKVAMPEVMRRYVKGTVIGTPTCQLVRAHQDFPTLRYTERYLKPNPYTMQERIQREELPEATPAWTGYEPRPGRADLKPTILTCDSYRCQNCQGQVTLGTSHLDHIRPVRRFRRPVDANRLDNLQTLCIPCHRVKTEADQPRESRVQ